MPVQVRQAKASSTTIWVKPAGEMLPGPRAVRGTVFKAASVLENGGAKRGPNFLGHQGRGKGIEMYAYNKKSLMVDLTTGEIAKNELEEAFLRKYLGGNGFAVKTIYDMVPAHIQPFDEGNVIVFATGPMNETPVWGCGRGHLAAISPVTGYFADSNFGGDFASSIKKSGYDFIAIVGKAEKPSYLLVDGDRVSINPCEDLWGKDTELTHKRLEEVHGSKIESATIGPAGENGVPYANIMCSGNRFSAAGRCGIGAVMGSKNLKSLVVKGTETVEVAEKENLKKILKEGMKKLRETSKALTAKGTPGLVNVANAMGMFATKNNTRETFEGAHKISGEVIEEKYKEKNITCAKCPIACGNLVKVTKGEFQGRSVKSPEYETCYSLGSMLENDDIVSIFNTNTMCDLMGLDTISFGVTVAFLAECVEKGIVKESDLDVPIRFQDGETLPKLAHKTAYKEGVGQLLAIGSERLAERFGGESKKLLYSVKGLEIAGHSARAINTMGLSYAVSTRGGSNHDARPNYANPDLEKEKAAAYCVSSQNNTAMGDSLVMCRFVMERAFGPSLDMPLLETLNAVTGWGIDFDEFEKIGERIYTLERFVNTRRGLDRSKDTLPYRVLNEPIQEGPTKGKGMTQSELDTMLDEYYQRRGWDNNGIPTQEKLAQLGIV